MTPIKTLAAIAAVATLALAATDLSASAQSSLSDGPSGFPMHRPSRLGGAAPSRGTVRRRPMNAADRTRPASYADHRPLTVRRTVAAGPVAVAPAPRFGSGPGAIVTGPLGFGSAVVGLPFQAVGGIFPATGDIATNPLVLVGAPLHAVGEIVQLPFRIVGAPFGGPGLGTY